MNHFFLKTRVGKSFLVLTAFFFATSLAHSATITVNSAADGSDATSCTLRDAVAAANGDSVVGGCTAGSGTDTIVFDASLANTTIEVANGGQIEISSDLTIDGGANNITLDADPGTGASNRIFYVSGGTQLTVENLTFQNGNAGSGSTNYGGAIMVNIGSHTLTVNRCAFDNNRAEYGGAIDINDSSSTILVSDSTFTGNTATSIGGAIYASNATVSASTFSDNSATYGGGAINASNATVSASTFTSNTATDGGAIYAYYNATVSASTFTGNSATDLGGAIYADENLYARHLTMVNNTATNDGASVYVYGYGGSKTMVIHNSIIVGANANDHCAVDDGSTSITGSYNLEWVSGSGDQTSCSQAASPQPVSAGAATQVSDIVATTLANNGGPTQTLALPNGSPAIGKADATTPTGTSQMWDFTASDWTDATEDQRGYGRLPVADGRDLGAFETNALGFTPAALPAGTEGASLYGNTGGHGERRNASTDIFRNELADGHEYWPRHRKYFRNTDAGGNVFGSGDGGG